MTRQEIKDIILQEKIVVIIRTKEQAQVAIIVETLIEAGIKVLEITSNTPGFEEEISKFRKKYPEAIIGAGTITIPELAQKAAKAGAQFIVTPNVSKEVVETSHQHGLPVLMGAMTPTEIANASNYGADMIKLFPADKPGLGVEYYKTICGPFDNLHILAVGGIRMNNIEEWFEAGISGVGVGGKLTKLTGNDEADKKTIYAAAKEMIEAVKNF